MTTLLIGVDEKMKRIGMMRMNDGTKRNEWYDSIDCFEAIMDR